MLCAWATRQVGAARRLLTSSESNTLGRERRVTETNGPTRVSVRTACLTHTPSQLSGCQLPLQDSVSLILTRTFPEWEAVPTWRPGGKAGQGDSHHPEPLPLPRPEPTHPGQGLHPDPVWLPTSSQKHTRCTKPD